MAVQTSLFLPFLVLTVVCTITCDEVPPARGSKPNIVVLLADDLGIGDLGCYGNTTLPTPNIDSLAADGVRLTHFLSAASVCTPSRAAFLTGRYPVRYGLAGKDASVAIIQTASTSGLPPSEVTFAEVLKEAGYKTALIGKWHLGLHRRWRGDNVHNPLNQGFDQWFGIPFSNLRDFVDTERPQILDQVFPRGRRDAAVTTLTGVLAASFLWRKNLINSWICFFISLGFVIVPQSPILLLNNLKFLNSMLYRDRELVEQPMSLVNMTQRLVHEGVDFLESRHEDEAPFLLYMSWLQTHTALHAGPAFQGASKHGRYGDEVMELDWSVGEILKALDRLGLRDNTLVIFSSDHGGHVEEAGISGDRQGGYNGIFRGGKFQGGMDGGIRVPGLIRWPGHISPQTEVHVPLSQMDFLPTVAEVAGVPVPADRVIDGVSLVPLLTGHTRHTEREYLVHYCSNHIHALRFRPEQDGAILKVRYTTPKWAPGTEGCGFICFCDENYYTTHEPPLVFDMAADPREDRPLSQDDPRYSRVLKAAKRVVKEHTDSIGEVENQFDFFKRILNPYLVQCCNFPYCTCEETKK